MELKNLSLFTDFAKTEGMEIGRNEGRKIGRNEGIKIGEKRGEKRGMGIALAQVVINAAGTGMPVKDISDFTGLSVKQIYKILSNKK
jgi:hypothetical protein